MQGNDNLDVSGTPEEEICCLGCWRPKSGTETVNAIRKASYTHSLPFQAVKASAGVAKDKSHSHPRFDLNPGFDTFALMFARLKQKVCVHKCVEWVLLYHTQRQRQTEIHIERQTDRQTDRKAVYVDF